MGLKHKHMAEELLATSGYEVNKEEDKGSRAWAQCPGVKTVLGNIQGPGGHR